MSILQRIRINSAINRICRFLIIKIKNVVLYVEKRWRLSGVIPLEHGGICFSMYSECDDGILEPLYYGDNYIESNDLTLFGRMIKPGYTVFDIGANTGLYSIFSGVSAPSSAIYSFEPNPSNLLRLKKNLGLNQLKSVHVIPHAIGAKRDNISFTVLADDNISDTSSAVESFSKNSYRGELKWKTIHVEQTTIDDFIAENQIQQIDLVKIDVEGYEIEVLKGGTTTFQKWKPSILIESFLDGTKRDFLEQFVAEMGYTVYLVVGEGIIRVGNCFESGVGLNYLLMERVTEQVFTRFKDIS